MSLHRHVQADDLPALRADMTAGADVEVRDADGLTPLMVAAGWGRVDAISALLEAGANVLAIDPSMGVSSLHKAAQGGSPAAIELLIDAGAFIDQQTPTLGNSALMDAAVHKHAAAVATLLARGAKTFLLNHWQQSVLDIARDDGLIEIEELIREQRRGDDELRGRQELMSAVLRGDTDSVRTLLQLSAPREERTPCVGRVDDDNAAIGAAARLGSTAIVGLLLEAGVNADVHNGLMRASPAHEAAYAGHADVIDALAADPRAAGLRVNLDARGDYNGFTALHDAVWHGHRDAVRALLRAGVDTGLRTHAGQTAHDLADTYGYGDIARDLAELSSSGADHEPPRAGG